MRTLLLQTAILQDQNPVSLTNGIQPMRDDETCSTLHKPLQSFLYLHLCNGVNAAGCLVEYKDRRVGQNSTGNSQQLFLPLTDAAAVHFQHLVVSVLHPHDKGMGVGQFRCLFNLLIGGVQSAEADIFTNCPLKQEGVL
ncbi:hypothetical protein D3C74_193750 [compost metagenome]